MAKDIRVTPELIEARRLALAHNVLPITHSFVSDLETPVSAFLKLGAPRRAFLLESAEQGKAAFPAATVSRPPRSGPCRSSTSSRPCGAAPTPAPSATSASAATSTPASASVP